MQQPLPCLSLAPMQDVTDLAFLRATLPYGGADLYTTPYFRAVSHSLHLEDHLESIILNNPTGKPVFAQIIGSDIKAVCKMAIRLQHLPIGGIDFNIGCPAPVVCRKNAGGGALKDLVHLDLMLGHLRDCCPVLSVKTRLGFGSEKEFDDILPVIKKHNPDMLTIHARTVKEGYQAPVHPDFVKRATEAMPCPVLANGNIVDTSTALAWMRLASPGGLMIGRGAIRNPWIFRQIRQVMNGEESLRITNRNLWEYILRLFDETARLMQPYEETRHIHRMKKFMVYILQGLPSEFDYSIRRCKKASEFHALCHFYLDNSQPVTSLPPNGTRLFSHFENLLNRESNVPEWYVGQTL